MSFPFFVPYVFSTHLSGHIESLENGKDRGRGDIFYVCKISANEV